jgi:hypothetical protein
MFKPDKNIKDSDIVNASLSSYTYLLALHVAKRGNLCALLVSVSFGQYDNLDLIVCFNFTLDFLLALLRHNLSSSSLQSETWFGLFRLSLFLLQFSAFGTEMPQ